MTGDLPYGLGWIKSPDDPDDWPVGALYAAAGVEPPAALPASYHVPAPLAPVLDQGSTPMCVAYSAAGEQLWYDLRDTGPWTPDEAAFFAAIGGTQNGAIVRDALAYRLATGYPPASHPELAGRHRIAAYYAVPVTQADLCSAILSFGPLVLGTPWFQSWFRPVAGVLPAPDAAVGGHAIQAVGWDATGLRLRNSWGTSWGQGGEATLPWAQLGRVREAWKAVDRIDAPAPPKSYALLIAAGALVRLATVTPSGLIAGWTDVRWGATASSAPCRAPVVRRGTVSGQATVAYVTAGRFSAKWVRVGGGVSVVSRPATAASEEDPR